MKREMDTVSISELKSKISSFDDSLFGTRTPMPDGLYPLPPVNPTRGEHPRLNLNRGMIPKIRKVLNESTELSRNFWELADEAFDGVVAEPPEGRSNYDGRHHAIIEAKALAYLLTDDVRYGYEAILAAKNYMLTVVIRHDLKSDIFRGWGRIMTVVGEVYDWCYPLMTEGDRRQFVIGAEWKLCRDCTCGKGDKMTIGYPPLGQSAVSGHGTNVALQRDYLGFAIAIYDEYPDWWELIGGRFYSEYVPANNVFYAAGMNTQGTNNYVWGKYYAQLHSAWLIKTMSGDIPYDRGIERVCYGLMGMKMPNGRYFHLGDGHIGTEGATGRVTHLAVAAALFPSAVLKRHARVYTKNYTYYDWDIGGSMMSPSLYAIFLANGYEGEEATSDTDGLELVYYFGSPMGQMTARDVWSENGAAVLMRISELTGGNHDHEDSGTFQIYYKGLFSAESGAYGVGAGYGTSHHKFWHQATVSHNGLLVYNPNFADTDGGWYSGGQQRHNGTGSVEDWLTSPKHRTGKLTGHAHAIDKDGRLKYAYLSGDISAAYNPDTVDTIERRMLAVYNEDVDYPMFFTVYDYVKSKDAAYKKSFLTYTPSEPTIDGNRAAFTMNGGKMVLTSLTEGAEITKRGGVGKCFWINDKVGALNVAEDGKGTAARKGDSDIIADGPVWGRIQINNVGKETDHLLNVIYVTDAGNERGLTPTKFENDTVIGMQLEDVVAVFAKGAEGLDSKAEFTSAGDSTPRYFVSGLKSGEWQVFADGTRVDTVTVTEESGLAHFMAPAGRITLTRKTH